MPQEATDKNSTGRASKGSQKKNAQNRAGRHAPAGQSIARFTRYQAGWHEVSHKKWDTCPQYRTFHAIPGWLARSIAGFM